MCFAHGLSVTYISNLHLQLRPFVKSGLSRRIWNGPQSKTYYTIYSENEQLLYRSDAKQWTDHAFCGAGNMAGGCCQSGMCYMQKSSRSIVLSTVY